MTTIAWDGVSVAADGRESDGGIIASDNRKKIIKSKDLIFGYCGSVPDGEHLIDIVVNGSDILKNDLNANLITIQDGQILMHGVSGGCLNSWEPATPYAMGSGEQFAIAAMDMGMNAKDAVKYAMTRDLGTGGKITNIKYIK